MIRVPPCRRPAAPRAVTPARAPGRRPALPAFGRPLPAPLRDYFEPRFQADFSAVRLHPDAGAAEQAGARAFTLGPDIAFAPGQYAPGSRAGLTLIAHELAHVVQQRRGGPAPEHRVPAIERDGRAAARAAVTGAAPVSVTAASGVGMARDEPEEKTKEPDPPIEDSSLSFAAGVAEKVAINQMRTELHLGAGLQSAPDRAAGPLFAPGLQGHVIGRTSPLVDQGLMFSYGGVTPLSPTLLKANPDSSYQTGGLAYTLHTQDEQKEGSPWTKGNGLNLGFVFGNPGKGKNWNPSGSYTRGYSWQSEDKKTGVDLNAGVNAQLLGSINNRNVAGLVSPFAVANLSRKLPFLGLTGNVEALAGVNLGVGGAADRSGADPAVRDPTLPFDARLGAGLGLQGKIGNTALGGNLIFGTELGPNIKNVQQAGVPKSVVFLFSVSTF